MLIAFLAYADQFSTRGASLIDKLVDFKLLRLQGERLADIALTPPEVTLKKLHSRPSIDNLEIEVSNISFRYGDDEPWILRNCSFHILAGESLAIIGPSGCGKTTLAKLILGLLKPQEGVIRIGGIPIETFGISNYRQLFGTVMRDDNLFSGSINENISFFDIDPNSVQIEIAVRNASVHDEIMAMPMGYETLIGDMGSTLSGGQKQRILLARSLYRRPRFLILDEASSNLDITNEQKIDQTISNLKIARVIITHRPTTILTADRVLVLDQQTLRPYVMADHISHAKTANTGR
jgi:ATP-binding cassette, subfamily B, bacterial CvaB/MchF/RaxB